MDDRNAELLLLEDIVEVDEAYVGGPRIPSREPTIQGLMAPQSRWSL